MRKVNEREKEKEIQIQKDRVIWKNKKNEKRGRSIINQSITIINSLYYRIGDKKEKQYLRNYRNYEIHILDRSFITDMLSLPRNRIDVRSVLKPSSIISTSFTVLFFLSFYFFSLLFFFWFPLFSSFLFFFSFFSFSFISFSFPRTIGKMWLQKGFVRNVQSNEILFGRPLCSSPRTLLLSTEWSCYHTDNVISDNVVSYRHNPYTGTTIRYLSNTANNW